MTKTSHSIINSKTKIVIKCYEKTLNDILNFGFSYLEQSDYIVEYIVTNSVTMKKIFGDIPDSILSPERESIGILWTAKLLISNKLSNSQIIFSNSTFSIVLDTYQDPNPNPKELFYANI